MIPFYIALTLLAAIASASPVVEIRQNLIDTQAVKTLQITKVDWQRSGSKINGVRFQATLAGTGETWRCTSSDSASTEGFALTKTDRCAKGSPISFMWDGQNGNGQDLRIWLTSKDKSYAGSIGISAPSTDNKVVYLNEIEVTPSITPKVDP